MSSAGEVVSDRARVEISRATAGSMGIRLTCSPGEAVRTPCLSRNLSTTFTAAPPTRYATAPPASSIRARAQASSRAMPAGRPSAGASAARRFQV